MLITFLTILISMISSPAIAQMASASIFPEMKSLNPAIISERPDRALSMYGKIDKSKKEKNLSATYGAGSSSLEKGTLTAYNAFYGGKGGGLTLETLVDISSGSMEYSFNLTNSIQGESKLDADITSQFIGIGFGIGKFLGISVARLSIENESSFTAEFAGNTFVTTTSEEMTSTRLRAGLKINLGIDLGLYYDHVMTERSVTMIPVNEAMPNGTTKDNESTIGFGAGINSKNLHLEAFYERRLDEVTTTGSDSDGNLLTTSLTPTRIGATIETKLSFLTLGYTGMYCTDGFGDLEREVYDTLMYGTSSNEGRLENTFNFSFGKDKGHIFGGSAFYSKIDSLEASRLDTENKYPTTITVMGASVKYSYAF